MPPRSKLGTIQFNIKNCNIIRQIRVSQLFNNLNGWCKVHTCILHLNGRRYVWIREDYIKTYFRRIIFWIIKFVCRFTFKFPVTTQLNLFKFINHWRNLFPNFSMFLKIPLLRIYLSTINNKHCQFFLFNSQFLNMHHRKGQESFSSNRKTSRTLVR